MKDHSNLKHRVLLNW